MGLAGRFGWSALACASCALAMRARASAGVGKAKPPPPLAGGFAPAQGGFWGCFGVRALAPSRGVGSERTQLSTGWRF